MFKRWIHWSMRRISNNINDTNCSEQDTHFDSLCLFSQARGQNIWKSKTYENICVKSKEIDPTFVSISCVWKNINIPKCSEVFTPSWMGMADIVKFFLIHFSFYGWMQVRREVLSALMTPQRIPIIDITKQCLRN